MRPRARSTPIRRMLMRMIVVASLVVLLASAAGFSASELLTFRRSDLQQLRTLAAAIATNSAAALAFDDQADGQQVLAAFSADPHIQAAALYDAQGRLFATYPQTVAAARLPAHPAGDGFGFGLKRLSGFQPIAQDGRRLGTLYVQSDLAAMYARGRQYALIVVLMMLITLPLAYLLSRRSQRQLSDPILALAGIAHAVSERQDYSVRAPPTGAREFDVFIDAFNEMLERVRDSEARLQEQLGRLNLLQQITRATGERQDLPSIFQVVLATLEDNLPIDFGCFLLYDALPSTLTVSTIGGASRERIAALGLAPGTQVPIDPNGLARCVSGQLVYEPDVAAIPFPFPQRLNAAGLRSLVIAPLALESEVFGVLVCARQYASAFSGAERDFLRQLSAHVALASHQARLYGALQRAYEDLRQTQHTVMQQERLRALGQMASGIAHDINNAISPVSLYTESLLEREPGLSERARGYLTTIQRAIEDVARTVTRMREFYREREAQLTLESVDLNRAVRQIIELTRPCWSDQPQQRGVMVELRAELADDLPALMGAENEIRDALTNLIFNAVDAMPSGGALTVRTRSERLAREGERVLVEVIDSGTGMDEETRRHCLEPFYTTKGERGTGLGLAMVYGMAQRHSAGLQIDSAPGQGTCVSLSFPALSASRVTPQPVQAGAPARRLHILLVDDDPLLIKSLQDTLQQDGHLLAIAHGGQAGIDAFALAQRRGEGFDVVVTDLGMPHVDGRKVAASIKGLSPSTPVVLLTGWGQRLIAANETPPHVNRVLSKPPRLAELRGAFMELVP